MFRIGGILSTYQHTFCDLFILNRGRPDGRVRVPERIPETLQGRDENTSGCSVSVILHHAPLVMKVTPCYSKVAEAEYKPYSSDRKRRQ